MAMSVCLCLTSWLYSCKHHYDIHCVIEKSQAHCQRDCNNWLCFGQINQSTLDFSANWSTCPNIRLSSRSDFVSECPVQPASHPASASACQRTSQPASALGYPANPSKRLSIRRPSQPVNQPQDQTIPPTIQPTSAWDWEMSNQPVKQ